jgi:hypothetical protein
MVFARGLWPSEASARHILDRTGRTFVPSEFNLDAFRADLNECRKQILAKQIDTTGYRKSHKKSATAVSEQAEVLRSSLKSSGNGLLDRQLWQIFDPGEYDSALALLGKISSEAKKIADQGVWTTQSAAGGPKDYLVKLLAPIYERHFQRTAGRSRDRDSHDVNGPFTRFADAVGREMSRRLHVSGHTVDKAFRRPKIGKRLLRAD